MAVSLSMTAGVTPAQETSGTGIADLEVLAGFGSRFHNCLTARADELFELADAVLCTNGPVKTLVDLTLAPEHRRGHGALYDGLNRGCLDVARLRWTLARLPLPRAANGRIVLAVDVSPWLRPDADTSPERLFCHVHGRARSASQFIPGWPYSFGAALEAGRTSWTAMLDVLRLHPQDDATAVTAGQLREVIMRLIEAGQWKDGDPPILVVADAGYDATRLSFLLSELPVELLGRLRSDRVMCCPAPSREEFDRAHPYGGRYPKHGRVFRFDNASTWHEPDHVTTTDTDRYGTAIARSWDRLHPRLTRRAAWLEHQGDLPIIEGTVIVLQVDHLPGGGDPKPVWLWWSGVDATAPDVDLLWQAFLRRFDLEHTFRLFKQVLGWTAPKIRSPHAADRWTWIIIAVHTQLRLARTLTTDLRRPWERPITSDRLTPARVRRGFRNIQTTCPSLTSAPKPGKPGPGRPPGSTNRHRPPIHDVRKTVRRETTLAARFGQAA
ncbi:NF041680 family putative transposase [Actinomadura fulvescens]|uniref:Transposase IS701-like DDE domain-containing protein n=1 Tax=Actinomadura fulvescens TaxID=46160 RepID=A0ABP6DD57_9ACTN